MNMNFDFNNNNNNHQHEEGLPDIEEQEQRREPSEKAKSMVPAGGFKDNGFLDPEDVDFDPDRMDLQSMDYLAKRLGVSASTARKIVLNPYETGFANKDEKLDYSKVGRKIEIPKQTADTLARRRFKKTK